MKTPLYISGTFLAPVTTTTLAGAFLLITITYLVYETFRQWYVAPGPPRLPILGNLLQIPSELQFIRYTKWAKIYGMLWNIHYVIALPICLILSRSYLLSGSPWSTCRGAQYIRGSKRVFRSEPLTNAPVPGQTSRFPEPETHSRICNDRPRLIMAHEILGGGLLLTLVRDKDVCVAENTSSSCLLNPHSA